MKRNKIIAVAVVVLMMVGALVLASCSNCPGDGECKLDWATVSNDVIKSWCFYSDDMHGDDELFKKAESCFGEIKEETGVYECDC